MPFSAGTAYLTVIPSFLNIQKAFERESAELGRTLENSVAEGMRRGSERGARDAAQAARPIREAMQRETADGIRDGMAEGGRQARSEGRRAGEAYAGAMQTAVTRRLTAAMEGLGDFDVDADISDAQRDLAVLTAMMKELRDKKIGVDIDADSFFEEAAAIKQLIQQMEHSATTVDVRSNTRAAIAELDALRAIQREGATTAGQGTLDGTRYGGAYAAAVRRYVIAAMSNLPDFEVEVDQTTLEGQLAQIKARLKTLSEHEIGVSIDADRFDRQLARLQMELEAIEANTIDIRIRSNAQAVLAEIRAARAAAGGDLTGGVATARAAEAARKEAERQAELARRDAERQGELAQREAERRADLAGGAVGRAARKALVGSLTNLPPITLHVNSSQLDQEIAHVRAQLLALSSRRIDVDINAEEMLREIAILDGRLRALAASDPRIDVHTNLLAAASELATVQAMVNRLDGQDIDIDVDTRGGIARIQDLADTAGITMSRLGLMVALGASIGTAIVPAAAAAAASVSAIATAASAAALGVGVLALGLFGVVKAVTALNKFQEDSKKSAVSLAGAQDRVANAVDSVRSAQRGLARAERERLQAVENLSRAQEEARRQLEDMAIAAKSNALAQRQATLDAADAKRDLDKILANPRATEEEREQARITYEQRVLQLEDLGVQQKRLADDKAKADKAGVAGSDKVLAAQERIADSTESVVAAQEQLAQSQRALAAAYDKTGVAGGEALSNLQTAMDALSPAGQRFALFIFSLKDQFKGLQAAAEGGLLPGLEQGIRNLLPLMPGLTKLVGDVAVALGEIFVDFTEQMRDPVWRNFFGYLSDSAVPTLKGMATFAGNVAKGIAGILFSLSGFNAPIGEGLLKWSEDFATWASMLDQNQGWQRFLAYVREAAPAVLDFLGNLWDLTKKIVIAAAPIGLVVVKAFSQLAEWLAKLDPKTMTILVASIAGVGAALLAVSVITAAIGTGIAGAIIGGVALVAAGLALLYTKVEPVRKIVDATVDAMGNAWSGLWNNILKPTFEAVGDGITVMKEHWNDLYQSIFVHVFGAIGAVISGWWESVKTTFGAVAPLLEVFKAGFQVAFGLFQIAVKVAGAVFGWLWDHVLRPIFGFIGVAFQVFSAIAQVAFGLFQIGVKIIAAIFLWFYDHAIKPVIDLLRPVFTWLADVIEKHVAPPFMRGLAAIGKAWDFLVEAAKVPIKFLIETVLNNGLLAGYNKIAKFFQVKPDDVHIDLPAGWSAPSGASASGFRGFAKGGKVWGAGTATSDSIPALLSNGEHVWTAKEVDALGGHEAVYRLRRMAVEGVLPAFAGGGAVGDFFSGLVKKASDIFAGVTDFLSNPLDAIKRLAEKLYELIPGKDSQPVQIAMAMPKRGVEMALAKIQEFFSATAASGNAGPGGAGPGFLPWPASPAAQRGDTGVWHNILNLVKSSGIPYNFGNSYRAGDPLWHGSGRAIDFMGFEQDTLAQMFMNMQSRVLELIHTTSKGGYYVTRGKRKSSMGDQDALHRNHLHIAMDSGGWLEQGWTPPIWNGTGKPEAVLTNQQWSDISSMARGGDGARASYSFQFRDTTLDPGKLRALQNAEDARNRAGRAR